MCHLTYMFLQHLYVHDPPPRLTPVPHNVESGYDTIIEPFAEANTGVDQHIKERETTQVITSHRHPKF